MGKILSLAQEELTHARETIFVARERGVDRGRIISTLHTADGEIVAKALLSSRLRYSILSEAREREVIERKGERARDHGRDRERRKRN